MSTNTPIQHNAYRTHACGEIQEKHIGKKVTISGWVHARRDHGGLIFLDIRDRWGIVQVTVNPEKDKKGWETANELRSEHVITVTGTVVQRPEEMINPKLKTGKIEIETAQLNVLSTAQTPPFEIDSNDEVHEELRLRYRYLDLRRTRMQKNLMLRHKLLQSIRTFFYEREFVEIETPILIKGTPEGAREYLVPSRLHPTQFYVLPQSPQQLKQLTMVAGFDRYMQIARCFRDEDQRGDRQPEFTQVDVEMSFVEAGDVMEITEECIHEITKQYCPAATIPTTPFPKLTWEEAMHRFGSDRPDLRFELELNDVTEMCRDCGFTVFAEAVQKGGVVKGLRIPQGAQLSRQNIDELTEVARTNGAGGLAWIKVTSDGYEGVPVKKMGTPRVEQIAQHMQAQPNDLLVFTAGPLTEAAKGLGGVRIDIAQRHQLADPQQFAYCWITDFPLFEKDKETGELAAMHHPFTRPKKEHQDLLETDPLAVRAEAYDIVLNGIEIAGGSLRIHEPELQQKIFEVMGISQKSAQERFGHLLTAFNYGAPPHGGIAWGFDRLVMLFAGEKTIRDVIAYPKDQKARDLMLGAPAPVAQQQLKELHVKLDVPES